MAQLVPIADWSGALRGNVVFVHGLGGHPYDTWRRAVDDNTFWPLWLAEDVTGLRVYSLGYVSPPTNWLGTAMPILDEAANILRVLLNEPGLQEGPIAFVCHSLGGLIVKQVLRDAKEQRGDPRIASLLDRVRQVVFIATPHTGSDKATLLQKLGFLTWGSDSARDLVANKPELRSLNFGYRELARERGEQLRHLAYYEMTNTIVGRIVDPGSADPGVNCRPTPIRADHISIAKPLHRNELVYVETRNLVAELGSEPGDPGELRVYTLPRFAIEWSWHHLVPKIVRLGALALLAFGLWVGAPKLQGAYRSIFAIQTTTTDTARTVEDIQRKLDVLIAAQTVPGAAQRVGEAVTDIAKGAAAGDERLRKALGLLATGDIDEASRLLQAVADEKTARIRQDSKEAALAFRNLGAIAGLGDPRRALDAYLKAIELDPQDRDSHLWVGWLELDRGLMDQAETRFRRVLILSPGDTNAREAYWARLGLGDIRLRRGDLSVAMADYREAQTIAQRLAEADPRNAGWQRDLSVSFSKIGDVQVAQGQLADALASFRAGLAIAQRLAEADPRNAGWQRDLSVSYERIGDVQVAQGQLADALASFRAGLAIAQRLAEADPKNAGWQRDLSVSYNKIGDVQVAQGQLADALASFRAGLAIRERLAEADPKNAGWQRDVAVSHFKLGTLALRTGDLALARTHLTAGRAISAEHVRRFPDWAVPKRDLAMFDRIIGQLPP